MPLYLALVHYPIVNKLGAAVVTSVTNFDIHDIARAARTYGVARYFIVTPIELQRDFVRRIMAHWIEGEGADYNPTRGDALTATTTAADLTEVAREIERDGNGPPLWVATSARAGGPLMKTAELRRRLDEGDAPVCLIFGTGHGLHPDVLELADATLEPIHGAADFNHLSVRSAVSIYLDRLFGRPEPPEPNPPARDPP